MAAEYVVPNKCVNCLREDHLIMVGDNNQSTSSSSSSGNISPTFSKSTLINIKMCEDCIKKGDKIVKSRQKGTIVLILIGFGLFLYGVIISIIFEIDYLLIPIGSFFMIFGGVFFRKEANRQPGWPFIAIRKGSGFEFTSYDFAIIFKKENPKLQVFENDRSIDQF